MAAEAARSPTWNDIRVGMWVTTHETNTPPQGPTEIAIFAVFHKNSWYGEHSCELMGSYSRREFNVLKQRAEDLPPISIISSQQALERFGIERIASIQLKCVRAEISKSVFSSLFLEQYKMVVTETLIQHQIPATVAALTSEFVSVSHKSDEKLATIKNPLFDTETMEDSFLEATRRLEQA